MRCRHRHATLFAIAEPACLSMHARLLMTAGAATMGMTSSAILLLKRSQHAHALRKLLLDDDAGQDKPREEEATTIDTSAPPQLHPRRAAVSHQAHYTCHFCRRDHSSYVAGRSYSKVLGESRHMMPEYYARRSPQYAHHTLLEHRT